MARTLQQALSERRSPLAPALPNGTIRGFDTVQPTAVMRVSGTHEMPAPPTAAVLDAGAGQWLIVSEDDGPATLMSALAGQGVGGAITDATHARCRIRLHGPGTREVLASGIAIDLQASVFPPGRSTTTAFRDIEVLLHATAEDAFDLYVLRSYALTLWEWLCDVSERLPRPATEVTARAARVDH